MIQAIIGVVEFFVALGLFAWGLGLKEDRADVKDLRERSLRDWQEGTDAYRNANRSHLTFLDSFAVRPRPALKKKRSRR